jgi:hypothetical protein
MIYRLRGDENRIGRDERWWLSWMRREGNGTE